MLKLKNENIYNETTVKKHRGHDLCVHLLFEREMFLN